MKKKLTKIITALLVGSMMVTMVPKKMANAAANEAYTVSTSYSYKNPETGQTADGSTNIALGESMIKSMLEPTALVEVVDGKTYVTIGLGLMSNISNVKIMTQSASGSYTKASVTKTGSGSKNGDTVNQYRFQVSSTSKYISPILYIDPMGRDVQFYVSLKMNTKKSGTGQYHSLLVKDASKATAKPTEKPAKTEAPKATTKPVETEAPKATVTPTSEATVAPTKTPLAAEQTAEAAVTAKPTESAATGEPQMEEVTDHTRLICMIIIGASVAGMTLVGGYYAVDRKRRGKDHE